MSLLSVEFWIGRFCCLSSLKGVFLLTLASVVRVESTYCCSFVVNAPFLWSLLKFLLLLFISALYMCLGVFFFVFILFWVQWAFLQVNILLVCGDFLALISLHIASAVFFLSLLLQLNIYYVFDNVLLLFPSMLQNGYLLFNCLNRLLILSCV